MSNVLFVKCLNLILSNIRTQYIRSQSNCLVLKLQYVTNFRLPILCICAKSKHTVILTVLKIKSSHMYHEYYLLNYLYYIDDNTGS